MSTLAPAPAPVPAQRKTRRTPRPVQNFVAPPKRTGKRYWYTVQSFSLDRGWIPIMSTRAINSCAAKGFVRLVRSDLRHDCLRTYSAHNELTY